MAKIKEKKTTTKKKAKVEEKKITRKVTKAKLPRESAHQAVRKVSKIAKIRPRLKTVPKPAVIPQEIVKKTIIPPKRIIKKEESP
ncbi:MAG: hypothetical protein Q8R31_04180, partial [Candidatus Omnitrophota bacterium]|nr:hypothetical protein [Candidatus Omnitrophota bacterium]